MRSELIAAPPRSHGASHNVADLQQPIRLQVCQPGLCVRNVLLATMDIRPRDPLCEVGDPGAGCD
jgi:hypothetical protein